MAEPALIDLVVVHELAHLKHRNHSPAFWAEVARHIDDVPAWRRRLRQVGPALVL
jgi:predicted metal-dependent hydrolase